MQEEQKETMSNNEEQDIKKYTTIKMANGLELISLTEAAKMMEKIPHYNQELDAVWGITAL